MEIPTCAHMRLVYFALGTFTSKKDGIFHEKLPMPIKGFTDIHIHAWV